MGLGFGWIGYLRALGSEVRVEIAVELVLD